MLLAIDAGNSTTAFGIWDGQAWSSTWREDTKRPPARRPLIPAERMVHQRVDRAICASVVPAIDNVLAAAVRSAFGVELRFLREGASAGLKVAYETPATVGADRLANAIGALEKYSTPIIVVDFGTATNFDVVDRDGFYLGGAIMPGARLACDALLGYAAKLPEFDAFDLPAPTHAIGRSTVQSLQSGILMGHAAAVDGLVRKMRSELAGEASVIATGGLAGVFLPLCEMVEALEPNLTLDGLRVAADRLYLSA